MNKLREEENDDLIDGQEAIIDRATPRVDRILAEHHEGLPVPTPPRKRKQRSDKGKPKVVKAAAPTADLNKRKHLALVEKLYALKEKQVGLQLAIDQTVGEINALVKVL